MAKELRRCLTVGAMKAIGRTIANMDMEYKLQTVVKDTRVTGSRVERMAKELRLGLTAQNMKVTNMKVTLKMVKDMALEYKLIMMEQFI